MGKDTKHAVKKIDLYFILLMALTYVLGYFICFGASGDTVTFIVMLNILYLLVIISYFTSVMASLISCLLFVFGYGSYILYQVVIARQTVANAAYFWIVLIPLACIAVAFYRTYLLDIQERILAFNRKQELFIGFDETTNHLNERMFHYEMARFMSMAKRGYIKLTLLVIRLKYYDDILKIIGRAGVEELFRDIGASIDDATRAEDIPYFVDGKGEFTLVTITDAKGGAIVKERVRNSIGTVHLQDKLKTYNLAVEVQIGIAEYTPEIRNALEFQKLAEKDMEFDV